MTHRVLGWVYGVWEMPLDIFANFWRGTPPGGGGPLLGRVGLGPPPPGGLKVQPRRTPTNTFPRNPARDRQIQHPGHSCGPVCGVLRLRGMLGTSRTLGSTLCPCLSGTFSWVIKFSDPNTLPFSFHILHRLCALLHPCLAGQVCASNVVVHRQAFLAMVYEGHWGAAVQSLRLSRQVLTGVQTGWARWAGLSACVALTIGEVWSHTGHTGHTILHGRGTGLQGRNV